MQQGKVLVSVRDVQLEVAPEFERLVRAGLECGVNLVDAFVDKENQPDQFTLVFPEAEDCLGFLEAFTAGADEDLRREVFVPGESVHGTFMIDHDGLGDEAETYPIYFIDLPIAVRDRMAEALEHEAFRVKADEADVDESVVTPDGVPVRLSELSRTDWGGEFATAVPNADRIRPGCRVRVLFEIPGPVLAYERIWVHVTDVKDDLVFGRIVGEPLVLKNLGPDDSVRFRCSNVCEVDLDVDRARMSMN